MPRSIRVTARLLGRSAAALAVMVSGALAPAGAELLPLTFAPPEISPGRVCLPREPNEAIVARWRDWDRRSLDGRDPDLVERDIRRLQQLDAVRWFDTIEAVTEHLGAIDPKYSANHALLDRIRLRIDARRFEELERLQLVPRLLASREPLSPRFQAALADLLRGGIGITADAARADTLLLEAGYAGNADALLALTARTVAGDPVDGWAIAPELSATMALGSLLGELNPTICDRIWRIARSFHNEELLQKDLALAERWYRFAADLGDDVAAWKVAEYHLTSEDFAKDNATLLTYLARAAEAGLVYAQMELGLVYEEGALMPRDLDRAYSLYRAAARTGERAPLSRLVQFLDSRRGVFATPADRRQLEVALAALVARDDAPSWAFTRQAERILAKRGRWAGEAEARALLERAVALGDPDAHQKLAVLLLSQRGDPAQLNRAMDLFHAASAEYGVTSSVKKMFAVEMCQAPDAPRRRPADHWRAAEAAGGTATLQFTGSELRARPWREDPRLLADMQTQALYGRPTAMAHYLALLDLEPERSAEERRFWLDYSGGYADVLRARAKILFELAATDTERWSALDLMRLAVRRGDSKAAIELAEAILRLQGDPDAVASLVDAHLVPLAADGVGNALALLLKAAGGGEAAAQAIYARFARAIADRGDFEALVFALPFVPVAEQDAVLNRAIAVMVCDFKSAVRLSEALGRIGRTEAAVRWLEIGAQLTTDTPWKLLKLGDSHHALRADAGIEAATRAYRAALKLGSNTAYFRLLDLHGREESPVYDPDTAADILLSMMLRPDGATLASALGRLRGSPAAIFDRVAAQVDLPSLYRQAAELGDAVAAREYALILREEAAAPADVALATRWLTRAAEGGDAKAMYELALAHAFGLGVPRDPQAANVWMERAAAAAYADAPGLQKQLAISAASSPERPPASR